MLIYISLNEFLMCKNPLKIPRQSPTGAVVGYPASERITVCVEEWAERVLEEIDALGPWEMPANRTDAVSLWDEKARELRRES